MRPSFQYWRPDYDGYNNIPCGTIRVTKDLEFHAVDLVWAVHGSSCRRYAGEVLQRVIKRIILHYLNLVFHTFVVER